MTETDQLIERLTANDPSLTELVITKELCSSTATLTILLTLLETNNEHITSISLADICLDASLLQLLLQALPNHLEHCTLQEVQLTAQQSRRLSQSLQSWSRLRTLRLSNNPKLGPRGCKSVAEALGATWSSSSSSSVQHHPLTVLDLSNTGMGHFGAQAVGSALPPNLQELMLRNNALGHDGVWKLAGPRLSLLKHLRVLDLSYNQCLDDGCLEVACHLPHLVQLQRLSLAGNAVGSTGVEFLALQLLLLQQQQKDKDQACCLQRLDLSDNIVDDAAVVFLAQILDRVPSLECLDLSGNQIQDAGCTALAKGIVGGAVGSDIKEDNDDEEEDDESDDDENNDEGSQKKPKSECSLRVLKLARNQIGDGGAGTFVEFLDDMPNLQILDLAENPVSEARIRILTMLLKHRHLSPPTPRTPHVLEENQTSTPASDAVDKDASIGAVAASSISLTFLHQEEDTYLGRSTFEGVENGHGSSLDEQAIAEGRENLMGLSFDSDGCMVESASRVPLDYVLYLTDNFNPKQVLSYGTFGALYKAKDDGLEEVLVVRRLCLRPTGPLKTVREAILTELEALRHENLLPLLALTTGKSNNYCFLYDVAQRIPLRLLLAKEEGRRSLDCKKRIQILWSVARLLDFLHAGGAHHKPSFHGDVQPSNIFVGTSPDKKVFRVQMTDGGLGRLLATDRSRFVAGDVVFATRGYRCPRYERGSCQYDAASDIFSYGIVVAEVLTGCLQGSRIQQNSGMTNDFYYENILRGPHQEQQPVMQVDPLFFISKQAMETVAQVSASCLSPVVVQRPSASTVERILGQLLLE